MNRRDLFKLAGKVGLVALASQVPWSWLERAGLLDEYMAEAALPQNYLIRSGELIADTQLGLAGIVGHQVHAGDATWAVSEVTTGPFLRPSGVTKIFKAEVTAAGSGTSQYRFDFLISRTLVGISSFYWPIYYSGGANADALFYVAKDTGFTNLYTYQNASVKLTSDRWNFIAQSRHQPDGTAGTPAITDTFVRVRMRLTVPAGITGTFYVCPIYANWYTRPQAVITIDDGDTTAYTKAFAMLQPLGVTASLGLNQPGVGGSGTPVTASEVNEMLAAGWSVHNHGASHGHMAAMNASELESEISGPIRYWAERGITLDPDVFLLPFGERNAAVDSALATRYRYSCTATGSNFMTFDGIVNPYQVFRRSMDEPATLEALISNLDTVEKWGGAIIFYGHVVADSASNGQTTTATLLGLAREIARRKNANRLDSRNLPELFAGLTNPRRKRLT